MSFSAQMTSVGIVEAREGERVQAGAAASSPGAGTTISLARYQFSIAVSAPGRDQSSR